MTTFRDPDISLNFFSSLPWEPEGGITFVDDGKGGLAAVGNGTNAAVFANIGFTSGSIHTIIFDFSSPSVSGEVSVLSQRDNDVGEDKAFNAILDGGSGQFQGAFYNSNDNRITSRTNDDWDDGVTRRTGITVEDDDLNIFENGLEVDYAAGVQDLVAGAGFANGVDISSQVDLTACAYSPQTTVSTRAFSDVTIGSLRIWFGLRLTPPQMLEEYNFEQSLLALTPPQSGGFSKSKFPKGPYRGPNIQAIPARIEEFKINASDTEEAVMPSVRDGASMSSEQNEGILDRG